MLKLCKWFPDKRDAPAVVVRVRHLNDRTSLLLLLLLLMTTGRNSVGQINGAVKIPISGPLR